MESQTVHEVINKANIECICDPHTGDCVSVAVAIMHVFDGNEYVCAYQSPSDKIPAHAAVRIDDTLYDGSGKTSRGVLYDFAISGLKSENIGSEANHIYSVDTLTSNAYYDKKTDNKVRDRLKKAMIQ